MSNPGVRVGVDPTNGGIASANHVKIGPGRSDDEVPPIKAACRGAYEAEHEASVAMVDTRRA